MKSYRHKNEYRHHPCFLSQSFIIHTSYSAGLLHRRVIIEAPRWSHYDMNHHSMTYRIWHSR